MLWPQLAFNALLHIIFNKPAADLELPTFLPLPLFFF